MCPIRLSLNADVDLKKLRFFSIPHDGGSLYTYPVSKELLDAQEKVVRKDKKQNKTPTDKQHTHQKPGKFLSDF